MSKVCAVVGCAHLRPCPKHPPRPRNASWSKDRDHKQQARFRKAVLARDNHRCVKCGSTENLTAHHVKPGYTPDCGITLCQTHHRAIDTSAR